MRVEPCCLATERAVGTSWSSCTWELSAETEGPIHRGKQDSQLSSATMTTGNLLLQAQRSAQEEQREKRWQQLEQAANKQLHSSASLIGNAAR